LCACAASTSAVTVGASRFDTPWPCGGTDTIQRDFQVVGSL
jgi:hypothetical protein